MPKCRATPGPHNGGSRGSTGFFLLFLLLRLVLSGLQLPSDKAFSDEPLWEKTTCRLTMPLWIQPALLVM